MSIQFKRIRSEHRPNYNLANEILMLNDHCLLLIFKHVSLLDLANFKEVCGWLSSATDMEFTTKTRGTLSLEWEENRKIDEDLQIIKQFGEYVERLSVSYSISHEARWSEIFSVINEHCSETLKALVLRGSAIGVMEAEILMISNILKGVESIELGYFVDYKNVLTHCKCVKSIQIFSSTDGFDVQNIFLQNENLLQLMWFGRIRSDDFETIVDSLMNGRLEELTLKSTELNFNENVAQLLRLNYLKRLSIDCHRMDICAFLQNVDAFNSLNVLSLSFVRLDERVIGILGRITRIKVLKLSGLLATDSPFESVLVLCGNRHFEHLLLFCYAENIDQEKYMRIAKKRIASMPEKSLNLILLHFIYTASLQVIPPELLEAVKETVKFVEFDRNYEYYNLE